MLETKSNLEVVGYIRQDGDVITPIYRTELGEALFENAGEVRLVGEVHISHEANPALTKDLRARFTLDAFGPEVLGAIGDGDRVLIILNDRLGQWRSAADLDTMGADVVSINTTILDPRYN